VLDCKIYNAIKFQLSCQNLGKVRKFFSYLLRYALLTTNLKVMNRMFKNNILKCNLFLCNSILPKGKNHVQKWTINGCSANRLTTKLASTSSFTTTPLPEFDSDGLKSHEELYKLSLDKPDYFWGTLARSRLQWLQDFTMVHDCDMNTGRIRWFQDGKINASGNYTIYISTYNNKI